jgi:predicted NAD/FAD-binding protein
VQPLGHEPRRFDHVIFACHSDQALRMLGDDALPHEREILAEFPYERNSAVLHTDVSLLPRSRRAWASWNYRLTRDPAAHATVTYNMNILQGLRAPHTFCVTLNLDAHIDPRRVLGRYEYHHPVFTTRRAAAQARHHELLSAHRSSFCGAYWGNGFHEDGVNSALQVVAALRAAAAEPTGLHRAAHATPQALVAGGAA